MKILHLTPHLGGGVGRALAGLVKYSDKSIQREILCLEAPDKKSILDEIENLGCLVHITPEIEKTINLIKGADIIQIEWWNHPALIKFLLSISHIKIRLVVWSHVSGLFSPTIPIELIKHSKSFVFTSASSFGIGALEDLAKNEKDKLTVISSSGGFDNFQFANRNPDSFNIGYIGTLSFSKLHPDYIEFIAGIEKEDFPVKLIGDIHNKEIMLEQCKQKNLNDLIRFLGFISPIADALPSIDILAYILNPLHYGTTENALLQAMSSGIVPIVLDNSSELNIVQNLQTGMVVKNPFEFKDAIIWLKKNPVEKERISREASKFVKERFHPAKCAAAFKDIYENIFCQNKTEINFESIFGNEPHQWFLSCQSNRNYFLGLSGKEKISNYEKYGLLEETKGSAYHFYKLFPDDLILKKWTEKLNEDYK